jgi:hypothetical protein
VVGEDHTVTLYVFSRFQGEWFGQECELCEWGDMCMYAMRGLCIRTFCVYTNTRTRVYNTYLCIRTFTGSVRLQPGYLNQVTQVAVGSNGLLPLLHYLATVVDAFSQRLLGLVVEGYFFWIIFAVEAIHVDLHLVF